MHFPEQDICILCNTQIEDESDCYTIIDCFQDIMGFMHQSCFELDERDFLDRKTIELQIEAQADKETQQELEVK